MKNKLFQLLARNREAGTFRAEVVGDEATIYLYDVIVASDAEAEWWGGCSAESFVKQLRAITAGTINIRINSPGGDVFAARAMEQAMREHPANIVAHVDGYAASAASLITVAADKAIMAPGSFMMIHKAWTFAIGNADDLLKTADLLEKVDTSIAGSYAAKAGNDEDFAALMAAETWFTAEETVAIGLADEVADAAVKAQKQPKWDMSAYEAAPALSLTEPANDDAAPDPVPAAEPINHRARMLALVSKAA